ncbi:MAG: alpha/beta hydrolase [Paludibacter sp.]|nr:alpha/beta hydrolase [Bacteroidales bacterium]MCM1069412.1 alpha/beta hydrolase [Prevotella sp.]MCM1353787.1 alpha/beta hydrolase [Bacteroides sp.]MCM1442812.1 alpha/beta hydrolase [Muribaculum sp.]MCM1481822.1 alpha/beta hydrolase [Paludibacter sp.]
MTKQEFYLISTDATQRLHAIVWEPDNAPIAVLQIVHGMVEYIDRYDAFARFLVEQGYAVIGHDHLGHGLSAENKDNFGHFSDNEGAETLVQDIYLLTQEGKRRFPNCPHLIMGHSMGSFFTRKYLTEYSHKIDGAIIMGTGYVPAYVARFGKAVAGLIGWIKGKRYHSDLVTKLFMHGNETPFKEEGKFGWLSRSKSNQATYAADPLCNFTFTVGAYCDFFDCMIALDRKKNFDNIRKDLPVLLVAGSDDPVGGGKAALSVERDLQAIGLTDTELHIYPDARHEILNEDEREQVYADILNWLNRVIQSKK